MTHWNFHCTYRWIPISHCVPCAKDNSRKQLQETYIPFTTFLQGTLNCVHCTSADPHPQCVSMYHCELRCFSYSGFITNIRQCSSFSNAILHSHTPAFLRDIWYTLSSDDHKWVVLTQVECRQTSKYRLRGGPGNHEAFFFLKSTGHRSQLHVLYMGLIMKPLCDFWQKSPLWVHK